MYREAVEAEHQQKILTVLVMAAAVTLVFMLFANEAGNRSREAECYESCRVFGADMVLVNRYGCVCQDESGPFMFGDQVDTD